MTDFNREIADLYPWLFKIARRYCSSVCDIEDLVGDTIYKVLSNKEKFKEGRALKPWCEVIMLNNASSKIKPSVMENQMSRMEQDMNHFQIRN